MKQSLPHMTRNTALAVTAFLLRIKITRRRVYTEDFLRRLGIGARTAHRKGVLGEIFYAIHTEDDDVAKRVVKAFNEEKLAIEEGRDTAEFDVEPEVVARIAARTLAARKSFMKELLNLIPFIRIPNEGRVEKSQPSADGSYTMTVPGFRDIRIDADETTRNHLGG